jgi:hypothetical protein
MLKHNEVEFSVAADMEPVDFDNSVPIWLLLGLGALTIALGLLLYYSY